MGLILLSLPNCSDDAKKSNERKNNGVSNTETEDATQKQGGSGSEGGADIDPEKILESNYDAAVSIMPKSSSYDAAIGTGPEGEPQKYLFLKKHAKADYLFIFDNSVTVNDIMPKVGNAFDTIIKEHPEVFAADGQIAVMTTMIANSDFSDVSSQINQYSGIKYEPGFLDFVNAADLTTFAEHNNSQARSKYPQPLCESEWFLPSAQTPPNSKGNTMSCLKAAFQNPFSGVGAEAGARAFFQLLEKNKGKPIFRDRAILNVIFVSDTHDPGMKKMTNPDYTAQDLKEKAMQNTSLHDVKFHALAPEKKITAEDLYNLYYFKLVEGSGGQKQHVGDYNKYKDFMQNMLVNSQETHIAEIELAQKDKAIEKVTIDSNNVDFEECATHKICINMENQEIPEEGKEILIYYAN